MTNLIYIAGGGAIGSLLRYGMSNAVHALLGRGFPYGTLAVNISGSVTVVIEFFDEESRVMSIIEHLNTTVKPGHIVYWPAEINTE